MELKIDEYPVASLEWGSENAYQNGKLIINKGILMASLERFGDLADFEITEMEIILPQTDTRVINVFDVLPAHARLGKGTANYPGFLDPMQTVGQGNSATLSNFSLLAVSSRPSRYNKVLDKSGPGSLMSPYSSHFHLAYAVEPKCEDLSPADYYNGLKKIGLRLGIILAQTAAAGTAAAGSPPNTLKYKLIPGKQGLPRAVYICMLAALQNWDKGEAVLYGNDLNNMLPSIIHPNELLDGCMIAQNFNLGIDTYSFLKNPVIQELYRKDGYELDFTGVVICASHVTREQRERSVQMTAKLAKDILGADMALLTKLGGGIPESDIMMTIENLESRGVATTAIMWAHLGDGTMRDLLTAYSPAANAMVSVGINDAWVQLSEQKEVVGGTEITPFSDDPNEQPQPAGSAIRVRSRDICGAISQLGASRVTLMET